MAKAKQQGKKKGGMRKHGRNKRKAMRYGSAISRFVRGKITGEVYFRLTRQKVRR